MKKRLFTLIHQLAHRFDRRVSREKTRWYYSKVFGALGKGCLIEPPLLLMNPNCFYLGENVQIRRGARLEGVCGYKERHFAPRIQIGSGCTIEQGLHLTCAESIVIGDRVAITEYVGIFDILHGYEDVNTPIVDQPIRSAPVRIGDHTMIGMGAVIHPGVTIGRHCVIGANAVVVRDVPDYSVAVGAPARVVRQWDAVSGKWNSCSHDR